MTPEFVHALDSLLQAVREEIGHASSLQARARCPYHPGRTVLAYGRQVQGWFTVDEVGGYLNNGVARWCIWVRPRGRDELDRWDELDFVSGRIRVR